MTKTDDTKLTSDQVAERLGCSTATVKRMARAGTLRPLTWGRRHYFLAGDVERLIGERGVRKSIQAVASVH